MKRKSDHPSFDQTLERCALMLRSGFPTPGVAGGALVSKHGVAPCWVLLRKQEPGGVGGGPAVHPGVW